jgi:hypothetical protein
MDKGHKAQFQQMVNHVNNGGAPLIEMDSLVNITRASFAAIESLKIGGWINVE